MASTGQYSKGRRRITEPVLTVPPNAVVAPRIPEEIREDVEQVTKETVEKLDKNRFVLRKTTGWLVAALIVTILGASAYLGSKFFTREHQVDHLQKQLKTIQQELEDARRERQRLERRIVELETQFELMQESP